MSFERTSTSFSPSTPSTPRWKYDVFLSFRGEDTRKTFTDHLYTALNHQGIITFRDDPDLSKGKVISPSLFTAIKESRFALIVLSKNYASSTWCLDELVRILECIKEREMLQVLPIFYDVDPSDVRKQTGSFGEAFVSHEERFRDDKEKVRRWRYALTEVASISGWNSKEWYESKLITKIVEDIWNKLQPALFSYAENLVGIDSKLQEVDFLLGVGVNDVRFIGIWGMGGIGKTTMVRVVYERIAHEFEFSFLLTNIRNSVEKSGLLNLQKQLLSGIFKKEADILNPYEGATIISRLLGHKKVLLILDDVNHSSHLKYLAGNRKWFGSGSRVLITTRNEQLLIEHGVKRRVKLEELNDDDSLELFSWKAFKKDCPEENFLCLSESVTNYAKGLPLALEVLGSFLHGRDVSEWNDTLSKLGRVCNLEIFDVLKTSYDGLDDEEKKIFLDIACFFDGYDKDRVTEVLAGCDFAAIIGIKVLMERSLVTLLNGRLWMHDLLQEMGHTIVRRESPNEPGRCSRLWLLEEVKHVLTKNTGTEAIEGIFVDSAEFGVEVDVTEKALSMMHRLRYLKIKNGNLPKGIEYIPNSLRILDWMRYPSKSLPLHFNPQKLVELKLCHSRIKHIRIGTKPLYNLKTIDLSHSMDLVNTPNFKGMPYLEVLLFEGCIRLYEVDPTIQVLEKLTLLNLKDCKNLVHFASSVSGFKSLKVLNLSGCSKINKLPDDMGHLERLEKLDVSGSGIKEVSSSIGLLGNLKDLSLAGCKAESPKLRSIISNPLQLLDFLLKRRTVSVGLSLSSLSGLQSLTKLNLSDCNLSEEALMVGNIECLSSLEELNLSRNQFTRLPESIGQLSGLEKLVLDWCSKLRTLPALPSNVYLSLDNCIALDTLSNQLGQGNSVFEARCINCFKMAEKTSCNTIALTFLSRYLKFGNFEDTYDFLYPGHEIPEWHNYQSLGSSITLELHPGWLTEKFMGFAFCVVFKPVKPLPSCVMWSINWELMANGLDMGTSGHMFGEKFSQSYAQPVSDHIWFCFVHRDGAYYESEWQDMHYQLVLSFGPAFVDEGFDEEIVQVNKCGLRMVYEEDAEELWQTVSKQKDIGSITKRSLQHCDDDDDDDAASSSASQAHPKRFKQLHLEGAAPNETT